MHTDPLTEYKARLESRSADVRRYEEREHLVSILRLVVAGAFIVTAWLVWGRDSLPASSLFVPVAGFFALVMYHERVYRKRKRAERAVRFYEHGIARINDRWIGQGRSDFLFAPESHLYAADLDLFGKGSLFELLCTARTRAGEETLARWLCGPADRNEIVKRQRAVEELRSNIDLREDLAILGDDLRSNIRPQLTRWSREPAVFKSHIGGRIALVLAGLNVFGILYYMLYGPIVPMIVVLVASIAFARIHRRRALAVLGEVEEPQRELAILGLALLRLEREKFRTDKLLALESNLRSHNKPASTHIKDLLRLVTLADLRRNQFFLFFSYALMWATQLAYAIEKWRSENGTEVPGWLATVGEFEALCALAGFAYEHPRDPFPEIVERGPILEGEDIGHPLLPAAQCVPNSVHFSGDLRLMVVSGSNMSGKSTLLRTVGVNVVLALAGGPVRANRLRVSPVNIGATLRIQDSLQAGTSRFYAEIQRLRQIMDLTKDPLPVLFLLDEILHGTNSHDRAIGAEAVVRGLVDRGAIGLVTTHDLALARVAESLAPRAVNVHFEDHLENGQMRFDYRLRSGVVQKSNALELMRAVGLDV